MPVPGKSGGSQPSFDPNVPRLVVIGNFDGVHRGHQAILASASKEAERRGLFPLVLTLEPHPAEVLGRKTRAVLTRTERKVSLLEATVPGLSVYVKRFDLNLSRLTPEEFAQTILRDELGARVVLVGENFRFGKGRAGDLSVLQELGEKLGFEARAEPLCGDQGGAFSSTRIRSLLAEGDVRNACLLLGRPHLLSGRVERGDQRGRTLGFPTANLVEVQQSVPKEGVYAVHVFDLSGTRPRHLALGVANLGARPTVERPFSLEVHLLDFEGDLYGKTIGVTLIDYLRPVEKFADVESLVRQIEKDVERARGIGNESDAELLV